MSLWLQQAVWFVLPVLLGGLIHVAVIKAGWFGALGRQPLDFGLCADGRRLLGANKTWRGALAMTASTALSAAAMAALAGAGCRRWAVSPWQCERPLLWGVLLGAGYILGELPNSAIKRRLDIDPGASASGAWQPLLWLVDQLDSVAGGFLMLFPAWQPTWPFVVIVCALTLLLHPLVALLMVALGLKSRVG